MTSDRPSRGKWLIGGLAALLLIAVGVITGLLLNRPTAADITLPDGSTLKDHAASQAALPSCAEIFVPGQKIDGAQGKAGCRDSAGQVTLGGFHECVDGRQLFTVDAKSGAPEGYGFSGDVYHEAAPSAADAGFGAAYNTCYGNKG